MVGWAVLQGPGTPSPSLGSTVSPGPSLPGTQDPDPNDYTGAVWVVVAVLVVALIIGGGTMWLVRTRRVDLSPTDRPDEVDAGRSRDQED
ncbi:hypothetical protein ACI2LF_25820 [Kribbella sp. NPDC020789]